MSHSRTLSRVPDLPIGNYGVVESAEGEGCARARWTPAQHSQSDERLTLMRIGALGVPSDGRRAEGLASGVTWERHSGYAARGTGAGVGVGFGDGRRIGAPPPTVESRG